MKLRDRKKNHNWLESGASAVAALGFPSNRMEIQTSGIMDEGWTFPGMKAGSYTTESLCTYRSHSCMFLWTETKALYCTSLHAAESIFKWCIYKIFCFPKELCGDFLCLSLVMYACLHRFPSSSVLSLLCLLHSYIHHT